MNNVTYGDKKLKRVYVNDKLADNIKYNNKQIIGYRKTSELEEIAFNASGYNINKATNSEFKITMIGTGTITTKYICKNFNYVFTTLPKSSGAIMKAVFGINGLFEIAVEYYKAPVGSPIVTVNGTSYQGEPNTIACSFEDKKVYFLGYDNHGNEKTFQFNFPVDISSVDIEKRFGYVKLTSDGEQTTEQRGVTGYFEVCDQYPIE